MTQLGAVTRSWTEREEEKTATSQPSTLSTELTANTLCKICTHNEMCKTIVDTEEETPGCILSSHLHSDSKLKFKSCLWLVSSASFTTLEGKLKTSAGLLFHIQTDLARLISTGDSGFFWMTTYIHKYKGYDCWSLWLLINLLIFFKLVKYWI